MNNLQIQTKIFLGAFSGILVARTFAPNDLWFLLPIGFAIWWAGTHKRSLSDYLMFSFAFSIGFWFTHISWLALIGIDAYILLALLMSLIYGLSGYLMYLVRNLPFVFLWYATIFIFIESITDYIPFGGFPWGKIAYVSANAPWSQLMQFGSAPLVTFFILLMAILIIPAVGFAIQKAFIPSFVFIIIIVALNLSVDNIKESDISKTDSIDLAIIQGSVPRSGLLFNEQKLEVLKYHSRETTALLEDNTKNVDLILWPENAIDVDPNKNIEAYEEITKVLNKYQIPILSGAVLQLQKGLSNSVVLWSPESNQIVQEYKKSQLVPFGEYLPFRELLSKYIKRFELIPQDFQPGTSSNNINVEGIQISPIVCFEIAWNKTLIDQIDTGGEVISIHTNNATYAFSNQLDQQFTMSRLRAKEMGRQVVISATTGISAHIDRTGEILWQSKEFVPQSQIVEANLYSDITPAVRFHTFIQFISLTAFLIPLLILSIVSITRKK